MTESIEDIIEKSSSSDSVKKNKKFNLGLLLGGITGGTAIALSVICAPFVAPAFRKVCLPYVPATNDQVLNVLNALKGRTGKLIDLGSGDGRIVIAAANKLKVKSLGVELNPWLVWYSRWSSWRSGTSINTHFFRQDLWKLNLTQYDNIVVFGVEEMMQKLEAKFQEELPSNGMIIACRFPLPNWEPKAVFGEGIDKVWVYSKPTLDFPR